MANIVRRSLAAYGTLFVASAVGAGVVRPHQLTWGATAGEACARLPGDNLMPEPNLVATRAITVRCPPLAVWPWLAQLGQSEGGLYSYDAIENLLGCDMRSADRIVMAWQDVEVGEQVTLAPDMALDVALVDVGSALVLRTPSTVGGLSPPFDFTWAFVLQPGIGNTTRLIVRERYTYLRAWAPLLVEPVEMISFVMSQKMLRGIRDRAESAVHQPHS